MSTQIINALACLSGFAAVALAAVLTSRVHAQRHRDPGQSRVAYARFEPAANPGLWLPCRVCPGTSSPHEPDRDGWAICTRCGAVQALPGTRPADTAKGDPNA